MMDGDENSLADGQGATEQLLPGPTKKLVFENLPRRGRSSLSGQPCRLASLAEALSLNLCHSQVYCDQILETAKMLLVREGNSQHIALQDGLTFFYPRPSAGFDIVARVKLLPVSAAPPDVQEMSAEQHLALGFGRRPARALAGKITLDLNKSDVGMQAQPDQAALDKHEHDLSRLDAKIKEGLQVATIKNAARKEALLQFLEEQKATLLEEQNNASQSDEDFLQLLERGVAQELAVISRTETRQGDLNAVEFQGLVLDEVLESPEWAAAKQAGRTEWGIEHEPTQDAQKGRMDETPFPLHRFSVPGLEEEDTLLPEVWKEEDEAVDPSTFRPSQHADGSDALSFELPTQGTDVLTVSRERQDLRRAAATFKAAWRGAIFEEGVGWAVVDAHTSLTEEETEFAETGYLLNYLRAPDSNDQELDFNMPAEQPAAWPLLIPDGVIDIVERDEATEAQLAVHAARAALAPADLAAATANRRDQLAAHFKSGTPSADFLAERLAPSEADLPAIVDAHTQRRQAEQALEEAAALELIEFAGTTTAIDLKKQAAFFDRKGCPPQQFLESNWPIDEAAFARAVALRRPYKEVKAAMDAGEELGETEAREEDEEVEVDARKQAVQAQAAQEKARREQEALVAQQELDAAEAARRKRLQQLMENKQEDEKEAPVSERLALAVAEEKRCRENFQRNPPYEKGHFNGMKGPQSQAIERIGVAYEIATTELKRARLSPHTAATTSGISAALEAAVQPEPKPKQLPPRAIEAGRGNRSGFFGSCCGSPPSRR
jgi:hypothetical protein